MSNYLYFFFFFYICFLFIKSDVIGDRLKVLSKPDSIRKFEKKPIPQVGGIILFLLIIFLAIIDLNIILLSLKGLVPGIGVNKFLFSISFFLLFFIGFIDDRKDLDPKTKLVLLIFVAYILFSSLSLGDQINIRLSFYKNIDLLGFYNLVLIFIFVFMTNALNMFDGLNLQSSITFLLINIYIIFYLGFEPLIMIIIIFLLVFSFFNYRNRAFLGDCGIYLLTFITFNFLLKIYKNESFNVAIDEFLILLILPIFDSFRVIFLRLKKKKNLMIGDRKHFHHLILNKFSYNFTIVIIFIGILMPITVYKILNLGFFVSFTFFILYYFLCLNFKGFKLK
jgi:UDP-GlcNAc:undecaprenyl-phosphate GlcNAc-1-phosphate transferase